MTDHRPNFWYDDEGRAHAHKCLECNDTWPCPESTDSGERMTP